MAQHNELGKLGEEYAARQLEKAGYHLLARNWRHEKAELDIVAKFGQILVFVEVKTRSADYFGRPIEFISEQKQNLLIEGAEAFLEEHQLDHEIRFDVIELIHSDGEFKMNHIEDAFHG